MPPILQELLHLAREHVEVLSYVLAGSVALSLLLLLLAFRLGRSARAAARKLASVEARFKPVVDIEAEADRAREIAAAERARLEGTIAALHKDAEALRMKYAVAFARYEQLEPTIRSLEENLEDIEAGLYRPHFTYTDTESYKVALTALRDRQRELMRAGRATHCGKTWTVQGSEEEGERMVKQYTKLLLRAFNAESDAAISNVSWNNFKVMENRIEKAFDAANKLGTVMDVSLTEDYKQSRLKELKLVFEAAEKQKADRDEQRRQRAAQREEERVQRELEREREDAEKDENKFAKALSKAKLELELSIEAEREVMLARVRALEAELAAAHDRKERAIAQAQLTRVGHVYVVSNLGAFGEGVHKIGLTRRLDPEDRIKELGDASVPFPFDLHALIYSEDAPALEARLHNRFWERRLNWANDRKEFFRVSVDEIQAALQEFGLTSQLTVVAEAREYRETLVAKSSDPNNGHAEVNRSAVRAMPADPFED